MAIGAIALTVGTLGDAAEAQTDTKAATHNDCLIEPRSIVDLGSAEEGIIRDVLVRRGDFVAQGDGVAQLEYDLAELTVELARLRAERTVELLASRERLDFRQREMARVQELHQRDVVSTRSRDEADTERQLAEFAVRAAELDRREAEVALRRAQASLDRHTIRSPVNGVVSEVLMSPGEYAHEQAPIMRIAEIDPLYVEVFLPISWYQNVAEGMLADVMPESPADGSYQALVTVVDRVFDSASGTFGVRLELANPDYEIPAGLRCTVRFRPRAESAAWSTTDIEIEAAKTVNGESARPADPIENLDPDSLPVSPAHADDAGEPQDAAAMSVDDLTLLVQEKLLGAGFQVGPLDGLLGPRTEAAIISFQIQHGLPPDGRPSRTLYDRLRDQTLDDGADSIAADPPDTVRQSVTGYDYLRRAAVASDRGDGRLAAFLYTKAIEAGDLVPLHQAYAHNNRGMLEGARGQFAAAARDYDRAIMLNPDDVAAYLNRAEVHVSTGRYAAAVEDYDRVIQRAPELAHAFHRRGVALSEAGNIERAIDSYDAAIELAPDLVQAYMDRGRAYRTLGRPDEAIFDFAKVFERDPHFPGLRSELEGIGLPECGNAGADGCPAEGGTMKGAAPP